MNRSLRFLAVPGVTLAFALSATAQPDARPTTPPAASSAEQQTPQPTPPASTPRVAKPRNEQVERPLIDIEFQGGTMGEFVQLVQAMSDPAPNIVLMPELEQVQVGKIVLKRITVLSALQAAITASEDSERSRRWSVTLDDTAGQSALYRVGVDYNRFSPPSQSSKPVGRTLQVFPFREWTGTSETMLSAIEGAVSMLDDRERPRISFHQESGLLFVSGNPSHIDMVMKVLEGMEQRANSSKNAIEITTARKLVDLLGTRDPAVAIEVIQNLKTRAAQRADAEVEAARLKATSEARAEVMLREMDDLKHRAEARVSAAEKEIQRLRAENDQLESQIRTLQAQNNELRDRAAPNGVAPK